MTTTGGLVRRVAAPGAASSAGAGAAAGLVGGAVFGVEMASLGTLPTVASVVRTDSATVGFVVHMAIAGIIGSGFGVLVFASAARPAKCCSGVSSTALSGGFSAR